MSELSPKNRALFDHGAVGLAPRQEDRRRIERALAIQIGLAAGAATTLSVAPAAKAAAGLGKGAGSAFSLAASLGKWLAAMAVVGGLGTAGFLEYRATHALHTPAIVATPAETPGNAVEAAPVVAAPSVTSEPAAPPEAASAVAPASAAPRANPAPSAAKGSVSEEAKLLRDADAALRSGDTAGALALLEEHRRTYPNGVLSAERNVERVFALCRMGRSDGQKEARRLIAANPKSPLAASIRASCGLGPSDP